MGGLGEKQQVSATGRITGHVQRNDPETNSRRGAGARRRGTPEGEETRRDDGMIVMNAFLPLQLAST